MNAIFFSFLYILYNVSYLFVEVDVVHFLALVLWLPM